SARTGCRARAAKVRAVGCRVDNDDGRWDRKIIKDVQINRRPIYRPCSAAGSIRDQARTSIFDVVAVEDGERSACAGIKERCKTPTTQGIFHQRIGALFSPWDVPQSAEREAMPNIKISIATV